MNYTFFSWSRDWAKFDFCNHILNVLDGTETRLTIKEYSEYIEWSKTNTPTVYEANTIVDAIIEIFTSPPN